MSVAYGEQQRQGSALGGSGAASQRDLERQYHVVLQDSLGHPALGFRDGTWFRLTVSGPQPLQLRGAIRTCPHAAGSIVQIACWWMRENPAQPRSLDLATELALTVGELVRVCPSDGLGSTSMDLLPMAMAAVAQSGPPVSSAPALPAGTGSYSGSGSGDAYGAQAQAALSSSGGSYTAVSDPLYGSGPTNGSANGYGAANGTANGYSTTNGATNGYSANGATNGYGTANGSAANGYGSANGYGTSAGTTNGYSAENGSANGYGTSAGTTNGYSAANSSANGYGSGSYAAPADASQTSYSAAPSYSNDTSYDAAQTSYLPATAAPPEQAATGWFEPTDATGTGGFPKVPPAPVMGRPTAPSVSTPPPSKPYPPASRGYNAPAQPQAALPPAAGADWEPRPAAPRRPSHQPRPQQQAAPRPAPGANGQAAPRPRPQQPQQDFERRDDQQKQQDPGRSSDRNPVPPRRPNSAAQPRGTMGRRPATRPGRQQDW